MSESIKKTSPSLFHVNNRNSDGGYHIYTFCTIALNLIFIYVNKVICSMSCNIFLP